MRIHFQDDVIFIQLSEDGGDERLAESVVKRVLSYRGKNFRAANLVAIDGKCGRTKAWVNCRRATSACSRVCFHLSMSGRSSRSVPWDHPPAVLKLGRLNDFELSILHGLDEERNSSTLASFGLEARMIWKRDFCAAERLEISWMRPLFERVFVPSMPMNRKGFQRRS